ncbi:hypothetical protein ACBI99_44205 [Nonomuraea sp. ATR24]|uniref:hypothetical protein n=1 Tax=Nonomuraea sp. ATR24 TaxID=1676744 RepID=UPI0035BFDF35
MCVIVGFDRSPAAAAESNAFIAAIERGRKPSPLTSDRGARFAHPGWNSKPLVRRTNGSEGLASHPVGAGTGRRPGFSSDRGLGAAQAVLGRVSDMVVHCMQQAHPVLVVPHPLLPA